MEKKINSLKMLCAIIIVMAGSLSANADGSNYYRNFLTLSNQDVNNTRTDNYTIELVADVEEGDEERTFNVVLNWNSSLDSQVGGENMPQTYTVYIVDENGYYTALAETDQTTFIYTVPQSEYSYSITYVVYGESSGDGNDMLVAWSNTDVVIIPGWYDFLALLIDHYESDYVVEEEHNYYRNFLTLNNMDEANALTIERVNCGEDSFTLYRYDIENPDVLTAVAVLRLAIYDNHVIYTIEYDDMSQMYLPTDNTNVTTQGNLADYYGAIDFNGLMFVDRFAADVSMNAHPYGYGYVLRSTDDVKSSNYIMIPVMKVDATIDGFYTQQEVVNDVDATLIAGVKNANVGIVAENNYNIYYYTLERGDNTLPNELISHFQRRTDGTYMEMYSFLPQYDGAIYEPGLINRHDDNIIIGEIGDYMSYQATVQTFCMQREDYLNNSYGSPILKTGVANVDMMVNCSTDKGVWWLDEDGKQCLIFNPVIHLEAQMPEGSSVEYEPYMFRVWRICDGIRNYEEDSNGHLVNDISTPRESFQLIAEVYDNSSSIHLGSEDGQELAFGALADSGNGGIELLARLYYKNVTVEENDDDNPMYYVVENRIPLNNIIYYANYGDVNGDGSITIRDVTVLIDYLLGSEVNINMTLADMNGDGEITISDVTMLIDLILSIN